MPSKRLSASSRVRLAAHHGTAVQTNIQLALKTAVLVFAAVGIAAAAAAVTVVRSRTALTVAAEAPGRSPASVRAGDRAVPVVGLRLRGWGEEVSVRELAFDVVTDGNGTLRGSNQAPVDAASILSNCGLYTTPDQRVSGPVDPLPGTQRLTFATDMRISGSQWTYVRVVCDVRGGAPSAALALVMPDTSAVRAVVGTANVEPNGVSFGLVPGPFNARGNSYMIQVAGGVEQPDAVVAPPSVGAPSVPGTPDAPVPPPFAGGSPAPFLRVSAEPADTSSAVVAEQAGVDLGSFRLMVDLRATDAEPVRVRRLAFAHCSGAPTTGPCTSVSSPFVMFSLSYVGVDGTTRVATARPEADGRVLFSGLDVPVNPEAVVSLAADAGPYFADLAGRVSAFVLTDAAPGFEALGMRTGTPYVDFDGEGTTSVFSARSFAFARSVPSLHPITPPETTMTPSLTEVLRFGLSASRGGPVSVRTMTFRFGGTDKGASQWLLCEQLGRSSHWGLRDATDPDRRLEDPGDWSFFQADGAPCAPGRNVAYAVVDFTAAGNREPLVVPAGGTRTLMLRVDSSRASATLDDVMRIDLVRRPDIPSLPGFVWSDGVVPFSDRHPGSSFPLFGTAVQF